MTDPADLLTPQDAARFLGLAVQTLARKPLDGSGPSYCKIGGRVRYKRSALLAWADLGERRSTSDNSTPPARSGRAA